MRYFFVSFLSLLFSVYIVSHIWDYQPDLITLQKGLANAVRLFKQYLSYVTSPMAGATITPPIIGQYEWLIIRVFNDFYNGYYDTYLEN